MEKLKTKRRKRIKWELGDVFGAELPNGEFALLQAIDFNMMNILYVAITDKKIKNASDALPTLESPDIISLIAVVKHDLEFQDGFLRLGTQKSIAQKSEFKNERFKDNGYIGAKMYDAGLARDFLAAYHKLAPWDKWYDPNYLDEFLISPEKKPKGLVYLKNQ